MLRNKLTLLLVPMISALTLHAADPLMNDPFEDEMFQEMQEMQKEMGKVFERMHQRMQMRNQQLNQPNVQFYVPASLNSNNMFTDKGDHYEYDTGIKTNQNNQINLSVKDGILTFRAKVTETTTNQQQGMHSQQSYTSVIQRSQTVPVDADPNSVKVEAKNGMILVTMKKKNKLKEPLQNPSKQDQPSAVPSKKNDDSNTTYKKVPHSVTEA